MKRILDSFEEYTLIASFFVVVPLLFLQIVMRYVFGNSLSWSEELARYIFLWQIWIGSGYAVKKGRHIRIEIIKDKMKEKSSIILEMFVTLIWIGFCCFLAIYSKEVTSMIFRLAQKSPALGMPMGIPYLSVVVGNVLMIIHLIEHEIELYKSLHKLHEEGAE